MGSKEKRKLSKKLNFAEIGGETHKCCENKLRGKFMSFVEIGENMQFTSLAWGDGRPLIAVANLEGCIGLSMSIGSVERIVDYRFISPLPHRLLPSCVYYAVATLTVSVLDDSSGIPPIHLLRPGRVDSAAREGKVSKLPIYYCTA